MTDADGRLMDGTVLAGATLASVADRAQAFSARCGRPPRLATVLVGQDPGSVTYVNMKRRRARKAGVETRLVHLGADSSTKEVVETVDGLSADPDTDGILIQHPVPAGVDEREAFEAINPAKDVDGVTTASLAAMALGLPGFVSATPGGIIRLLDAYGVELAGAHAVVIGRSPILGKPVALLLLARDATVTVCHSKTVGLAGLVAEADIVVAGLGRPRFVQGDWIKPGAVVIDAGYNKGNIGDVDFEAALSRARLITPVPGGVGPMTIAVMLDQTVKAAFAQAGQPQSGSGST